MKVALALLGLFCLIGIALSGTEPSTALHPMERTVRGQTLSSPHTPKIELTFNPAFRYAGGQRFVLLGIADAEQHIFVDADAKGNVHRMFWIQFEGFLPNDPDTYNYKAKRTARFGDFDFITDVQPFGTPESPDSDGGHVAALLQAKGFHWPVNGVRARFIHLPTADRRNELMIIYVEDAQTANVSKADLADENNSARWTAIATQLLAHAQKSMQARP